MVKAYVDLVAKRIAYDPITATVQLVTNQRIDDAHQGYWCFRPIKAPKISSDLKTLIKPSGLTLSDSCEIIWLSWRNRLTLSDRKRRFEANLSAGIAGRAWPFVGAFGARSSN